MQKASAIVRKAIRMPKIRIYESSCLELCQNQEIGKIGESGNLKNREIGKIGESENRGIGESVKIGELFQN